MQGKIRKDILCKDGSITKWNNLGMSHAKSIFAWSRILNEAFLVLIRLILQLFTFEEFKKIWTKQSTVEHILLISFISSVIPPGYDMSTFIRRYSRYLNEKAFSYRQMAFDFARVKKGYVFFFSHLCLSRISLWDILDLS